MDDNKDPFPEREILSLYLRTYSEKYSEWTLPGLSKSSWVCKSTDGGEVNEYLEFGKTKQFEIESVKDAEAVIYRLALSRPVLAKEILNSPDMVIGSIQFDEFLFRGLKKHWDKYENKVYLCEIGGRYDLIRPLNDCSNEIVHDHNIIKEYELDKNMEIKLPIQYVNILSIVQKCVIKQGPFNRRHLSEIPDVLTIKFKNEDQRGIACFGNEVKIRAHKIFNEIPKPPR